MSKTKHKYKTKPSRGKQERWLGGFRALFPRTEDPDLSPTQGGLQSFLTLVQGIQCPLLANGTSTYMPAKYSCTEKTKPNLE